MMKIKVENLGTIKQGEIALDKNLIVLAGPNHSGKSYLAYLIYGLLKIKESNASNPLYNKYKESLYQYFDQENVFSKFMTKKGLCVNKSIFFKENAEHYHRIHSQVLLDSMMEVFASKELQPQIQLAETDAEMNCPVTTEFEEIVQLNGLSYRCRVSNDWFELVSDKHQNSAFNLIKRFFYEVFVVSNAFNSYFFPAERSALNLISNEVIKEKALERDDLARQINAGDSLERIKKTLHKKRAFVPRYPLPISDYMYFINDLIYLRKNGSDYVNFAHSIEKTLMHGKVLVTQQGELQFKPNKLKKPLPLHLASSLVKSLAGLVVYFRYLARENDVIIIDEPELNLHPDNQRWVAKILAKATNVGFKIILSTHSNYIIKEFNNLIMLSNGGSTKIKKALLKQYGYNHEMILDIDTVGAYFFNNNTIHSVPMTEKGFAIETINEEIDDLEDTAMNIYFELLDN